MPNNPSLTALAVLLCGIIKINGFRRTLCSETKCYVKALDTNKYANFRKVPGIELESVLDINSERIEVSQVFGL